MRVGTALWNLRQRYAFVPERGTTTERSDTTEETFPKNVVGYRRMVGTHESWVDYLRCA
jgi:hypothetical protein